MNSKIIGHAWITSIYTIGVIVTKDKVTGRYKGRIGVVEGPTEDSDLSHIHKWGAKIPVFPATLLINSMGQWYGDDRPALTPDT